MSSPSNSLSGNVSNPIKNAAGRDDGNHVIVYRAANIHANEDINLTVGGFILIAMLKGGDYIPVRL